MKTAIGLALALLLVLLLFGSVAFMWLRMSLQTDSVEIPAPVPLQVDEVPIKRINAAGFLPSGKQLLATDGFNSVIWDMATGKPVQSLPPLWSWGPCISANGRMAFSLNPIGMCDLESAKLLWQKPGSYATGALSADGQLAIAGTFWKQITAPVQGAKLNVIDTATGKVVWEFEVAKKYGFIGVAIAHDHRIALAKSSDGNIRVFDLESGAVIKVIDDSYRHFPSSRASIGFSPDAKQFYSRHFVSRTWDVATGQLLKSVETLPPGKFGLAYSLDGGQCACFEDDDRVAIELYDVATGKLLRVLRQGWPSMFRLDHVHFSPDGQLLAAGGESTSLPVWHVETGKLLWELVPIKKQG